MASYPKKQRMSADSCLETFISWCETNGFNLNRKVSVKAAARSEDEVTPWSENVVAELGMMAIADLDKGEELFRIPRKLLIHPKTSHISETIEINKDKLKGESGWVPLLITLMFEYTFSESSWRSYLDLCVDHHVYNLPMFWSFEQLGQLKGTGINEEVNRDLENIATEFDTIVLPFLKEHSTMFNTDVHTFELYKKMVAFVMSYSFTEPPNDVDRPPTPPMMVPMADILNHVSKHNACLEFDQDCLRMVTTCKINAGEEVYNTYGELSNSQLLHMYGFAEKPSDNVFDVVEFTSDDLFDQAKLMKEVKIELLDEKMLLLGKEETFVVGNEGILTEDEINLNLKVLFMPAEEFKNYKRNNGWMSDDDEDINFDFDHLKELPNLWKILLASVAKECLARYHNIQNEDAEFQNNKICFVYVGYVKEGQIKLLQSLLSSLNIGI
ncbi:N-lysine methyltransferase setd6-like [Antedon mediterranea]|uniref:N-lysine methyltransferase setd6-like n=1 Tax=Antedon mediterranea TaxID=105859 RepID=UPI003AF4F645